MSKLSSDSRRLFLTQAGLAGMAQTAVDLAENRPAQRLPEVIVASAPDKTNKERQQYKEGHDTSDWVTPSGSPRYPSVYRSCRMRAARQD